MSKVDVAGLKIDDLSKKQLLDVLTARIKSGKKTWLTTPYSEFLYAALQDPAVMQMLNNADISVPDGIGLFWAARYLSIPLTAKSYYGKILQAAWQAKYSLAAILFRPQWVYAGIPGAEKIPGSDLVWDIAKLAGDNNLSIFLLGGFGNTPKLAADQLISKSAGQLQVATSNKNPDDPTVIEDINKVSPDILLVAYGPIKQERWISHNISKLNIKLAIGLGGTFDYMAGKKSAPPSFVRKVGLEWLWRLFTQPKRLKRIWQATFGLAWYLIRYKVFMSFPLRDNVVNVIVNNTNRILVCKRNPNNPEDRLFGFQKKDMADYWQFSQGGIDAGEDLEQTVARECKEELGLEHLSIFKISQKKYSYLYPNALRPLLARQSKYKGQVQSIAYIKYGGHDSDIQVDNLEFVAYKWVALAELSNVVHEHRKTVAKIIQEDLAQHQFSRN